MIPKDTADCECRGWGYGIWMGAWPAGGHHPSCSKGHPDDCDCARCNPDKIPSEVEASKR